MIKLPTLVPIIGSCYKLFRNEQLTWNEARLKCASEGAHLAAPRTSRELGYIRGIIKYYIELISIDKCF